MTITAISDTHGKHKQLDLTKYPADVLVFAGDWTIGRDLGLSETIDFLTWFNEQPYKHKLFIAGNHELQIEADETRFLKLLENYQNIRYIHHTTVTIDNVNFYGSNYSNNFYNWAYMEEEPRLSAIWDTIPSNTNVLVTHGPAYGTHDLVNRPYGRDPHVGSKSLYYRKLAIQDSLQLHISGHIHEAYGISNTNDIINVGASLLDDEYQLVNTPITIKLKDIT